MPQLKQSWHNPILITGINGYIATNIGMQLLRKGYPIRGTSRSWAAYDQLLNNGGPFTNWSPIYEHVVVPDITVPGAFDKAVEGVCAIIHVASVVDFSLTTIDEFMIPAVQGTLSILKSALTHAGPQLKTFVLTSSIAAIADRFKNPPDYIYSEADWNTSSETVARRDFSGPVAYGASKTAAERAMWDFRSTNSPPFTCTAINPGVVTGPPILFPASPEGLNETLKPIWKIYSGTTTTMPPPIGAANYIDVRDVAAMHVWAVINGDESDGQRYLVTNGIAPPQAVADLLRQKYPDREIIVGEPGKGYTEGYGWVQGQPTFLATKAYKALGVERFIGFEKSVLDSVEAFEKRWPGLAKNFRGKS